MSNPVFLVLRSAAPQVPDKEDLIVVNADRVSSFAKAGEGDAVHVVVDGCNYYVHDSMAAISQALSDVGIECMAVSNYEPEFPMDDDELDSPVTDETEVENVDAVIVAAWESGIIVQERNKRRAGVTDFSWRDVPGVGHGPYQFDFINCEYQLKEKR